MRSYYKNLYVHDFTKERKEREKRETVPEAIHCPEMSAKLNFRLSPMIYSAQVNREIVHVDHECTAAQGPGRDGIRLGAFF